MLLPKNIISRLQLFDAVIIRNFKLKYRKRLLRFVVGHVNDIHIASQIIEETHIRQAI